MGKVNRALGETSLSHLQQLADLGHAGGAIAEQKLGDGTLRRIVRKVEGVAYGQAMIDHHAGE